MEDRPSSRSRGGFRRESDGPSWAGGKNGTRPRSTQQQYHVQRSRSPSPLAHSQHQGVPTGMSVQELKRMTAERMAREPSARPPSIGRRSLPTNSTLLAASTERSRSLSPPHASHQALNASRQHGAASPKKAWKDAGAGAPAGSDPEVHHERSMSLPNPSGLGPPRLPHGLTVKELKELTRMRLAREMGMVARPEEGGNKGTADPPVTMPPRPLSLGASEGTAPPLGGVGSRLSSRSRTRGRRGGGKSGSASPDARPRSMKAEEDEQQQLADKVVSQPALRGPSLAQPHRLEIPSPAQHLTWGGGEDKAGADRWTFSPARSPILAPSSAEQDVDDEDMPLGWNPERRRSSADAGKPTVMSVAEYVLLTPSGKGSPPEGEVSGEGGGTVFSKFQFAEEGNGIDGWSQPAEKGSKLSRTSLGQYVGTEASTAAAPPSSLHSFLDRIVLTEDSETRLGRGDGGNFLFDGLISPVSSPRASWTSQPPRQKAIGQPWGGDTSPIVSPRSSGYAASLEQKQRSSLPRPPGLFYQDDRFDLDSPAAQHPLAKAAVLADPATDSGSTAASVPAPGEGAHAGQSSYWSSRWS
jgi:hypothetical protein